jgi:protein-disulfide isomerase
MTTPATRSPLFLSLAALALLLLGAVAGWQFKAQRTTSAEIGPAVREYLLAHPEVLPEAIERLRQKESGQQVAAIAGQLATPFPGAVLGNPKGTVTLVEFTDFACTYCRRSVADVEALIRANPDLRVVVRELPILSPQSADAARWGLAAAEQGRYPAFHKAMFAAGRPDPQTIAAAAAIAGLDLARARKTIANPNVSTEISTNLRHAQSLGIDGTPSWVIGGQLISGAVGRDVLAKAIADARNS